MNMLFWELLIELMEDKQNREDSSWYGPIHYEPSKWDLFMKRHKVINVIWPYVVGVVIGMLPLVISMILIKLGE